MFAKILPADEVDRTGDGGGDVGRRDDRHDVAHEGVGAELRRRRVRSRERLGARDRPARGRGRGHQRQREPARAC
jgi:hypothetical protein